MLHLTTSFKGRIALAVAAFLFVIIVIIGRLGWIQFVEGKKYTEKMREQMQENKELQSPRGTIFDRNGRELAISSLNKSLYVNPREFKSDADTVAAELAPLVNMKPEDLVAKLQGENSFVWIRRTLEPEQYHDINQIIRDQKISGLYFVDESKRYYPNDNLAAQVLGFVGTDDVGLDGLEMALDKTIKGKIVHQAVDTDNYGIPIFNSIFTFAPQEQASNVVLTLDSNIQFIVEQCLDQAVFETNASAATVIVMNPKTGEILAMANRPTFNPNDFAKYNAMSWRNRAVSVIYEPGSTFKSVVAAAALQEGLVRPNEYFSDHGYIEVSGRRIHNASGEEGYENLSFTDIIKNSVNTGFVQVGMRVGAVKLTDYARNFGFGKPTGIELPGEESGILFNPADMRASDTATMSIGQSIAVTPLQLLTAVSAIANDGVLLKPHIIKEIYGGDGSVKVTTVPDVVRQVISSETAHTLTEMLEKVISEGGGKQAQVKGYRFAGKTGTAERLNENGAGYEAGHYIASFVGFGPIENPQFAIIVVLDNPGGVYYGGLIAAPVFKNIATQLARYFNLKPQLNADAFPAPQAAQSVVQPKTAVSVPPAPELPPGKVLVPYLIGKSIRDAGNCVTSLGLTFVPNGTGLATKQSISANTIVDMGTEIMVTFE
ncbi:cell division protein FtsI/penicillin-binding protein 2 [Sporomusaceae bacterium BoRhaA]|uniref:penicillin-binding protein n=1 Tax=Pelorhabdus rhamnosifermentans TaxID=2772457 RepID=UPI001C060B0E|nr:penicillin-binding transpeptidase domain-containing protein [Pelorhabdus rhamnosifermentans]MBU2700555.1 cell division protein FtsI/penicillin-binding protein 2 [Pelorhabdus rhamnosifermentans]